MAEIEGPAEPGVVNPALIAQLGTANAARLAAQERVTNALLVMQQYQAAYEQALRGVQPAVPGTPESEQPGEPDPDFPTEKPPMVTVPGTPGQPASGESAAEAARVAYESAVATYEQ